MKNIDHTPDITSDEYWDTHHVAVVRLSDVTPGPVNRASVRHEVMTRITDAPMEQLRTTPLQHWWFGKDAQSAPRAEAGDSYVVFYPREGTGVIAAMSVGRSPEQSALVTRLDRIARLHRGEGGPGALLAAVVDPDRDVAVYSLKRLLKQPTLDTDAAFVGRLRAMREAPLGDPEVRILAGKLLARQSQTTGGDEEYGALERALSNPTGYDWMQLRNFAVALLEFPDKRRQTASLLAALVKDATKPQEARIAAYSVFEDPRLFQPDNVDAVSTQIFETVEGMLRVPEALLRQAGALLLHNLARNASRKSATDFISRARAALASALAAETDPDTQQVMKRAVDLLAQERG